MSRVQIALYKGPPTEAEHWLSHAITVAVLSLARLRWCPYSHAELVVDGVCHSSSVRDKGVRAKSIDLTSGRWVLRECPGVDADAALARFFERKGLGYDWPGALRWGLPFLRQRPRADYCFEVVAHMLGLPNPEKWHPLDLLDLFTPQGD
jgi:hypothetical protein